MNKRGSVGLAIISAIFLFIIGMMAINFLLTDVTDARNNLQCSSATTISDGTKLLCLIIDANVPYFIWLVLSISAGIIISRTTLG